MRDVVAYERTSFDTFLSYSNEKPILARAVVANAIGSRHRLLDVGAGTGELTQHYVHEFSDAVLIEPVARQAELLRERFPIANVVQTSAESFTSDQPFDLIVAAHSLYYLADPIRFVERAMSWLSPDGSAIFIVIEPRCPLACYVDHFWQAVVGNQTREETEITADALESKLAQMNMWARSLTVETRLSVPSVDDFLRLNEFLFNRDMSSLTGTLRAEMVAYLGRYLSDEGMVTMEPLHRVIVAQHVSKVP